MQFKDIKPGFSIGILDTQSMELITGKVTHTSFPYADSQNGNNTLPGGMPNYSVNNSNSRMVIDLTIEANGKTATYTVSENASVNYANHLIIAASEKEVLPALETMANESERIIASAPAHEERLKKIKELQATLNPEVRQRQEYDQRLAAIEQSQKNMQEMIANFIKEFKS